MTRIRIFASLFFLLAFAACAMAAIPQLINYQGLLTTAGGTPVADGSYSVVFTIYTAPTGGIALWTETKSVTTSSGLFSTLLGSVNPIPDSAFNNALSYLGIKVGADPEISPRQQLASVPYSSRVGSLMGATGPISVDTTSDTTSFSPSRDVDACPILNCTSVPLPTLPYNIASINGALRIGNPNGCWTIQGNGWNGNFAARGKGTFGPLHINAALYSFVAGCSNTAAAGSDYAGIGGGQGNQVRSPWSTIGGGQNNSISLGLHSTIGGGFSNSIVNNLHACVIGGGESNNIANHWSTIGGGNLNIVNGRYSFVGGGQSNSSGTAANWYTTVSGGDTNQALGYYSTVGGGSYNLASGQSATVGGGRINNASALATTIAGGDTNTAIANYATVGGGQSNTVNGDWSTIGGGTGNLNSGKYCTVGGGQNNTAGISSAGTVGWWTVVSGGLSNSAGGDYSTVPGGLNNTASGNNSFAAGTSAKAIHSCSFVWSDCCGPAPTQDFYSNGPNSFNVRADGGTYFFSKCDTSAGVRLLPGASAWSAVSDSTKKRNIRPVDGNEILEKLSQLPVSRWSYKAQDARIEHIGPMAQDFYRLFGLGEDEKLISSIDPDGVALAAAKALYKLNLDLQAKISVQQTTIEKLQQKTAEIDQLKSQLAVMSDQLTKLLAAQSKNSVDTKLAVNDKSNQAAGK